MSNATVYEQRMFETFGEYWIKPCLTAWASPRDFPTIAARWHRLKVFSVILRGKSKCHSGLCRHFSVGDHRATLIQGVLSDRGPMGTRLNELLLIQGADFIEIILDSRRRIAL